MTGKERRERDFAQAILNTLTGLRADLTSLKASLDKHIEAIREQTKPTDRNGQPQPPVAIRTTLELPEEAREYYRSKGRQGAGKKIWRATKKTLQIAAVLVALALAILTYRTLVQVTRQADAAQRQLEATDRPWMKITDAKPLYDLSFSTINKATVAIVIVAKNIGRSVALDVGIHGSMTLTEDERGLYKEQLDTCSRGAFLSPLLTVFPNDDTDNTFFIYGVVDIPAKIDHSFTTGRDAPILAPRNSKLVAPTFVGCITYTYPSTRKTHYSGFRFGLEYKEMLPRDAHLDRFTAQMFNKDHVHIAGYFVVGRDVSKEKLLVERFFSGFYAN